MAAASLAADISVPIELVEWQFKESRAWKAFPPEDNRTIEDAYRAQRQSVSIEHGWNQRYNIDFQRWELRSRSSYSRRFDIQRIVKLTPEQKRQKENDSIRTAFLRKNRAKAMALFSKYEEKGSDPRQILTDGILALLEELDLDPMDREVLVLCWVCDAKRQLIFTLDEFMLGLAKLNVSNVGALKAALQSRLQATVQDPEQFEELYMYAFMYMREGSNLSREVATAFWELLLPTQEKFVLVPEFVKFLQDPACVKEYSIPRGISQDVWRQMLSFFQELKTDLTGYDDECCPSLADSFVEHMEAHIKKQGVTAQQKAGADEDDMDW